MADGLWGGVPGSMHRGRPAEGDTGHSDSQQGAGKGVKLSRIDCADDTQCTSNRMQSDYLKCLFF